MAKKQWFIRSAIQKRNNFLNTDITTIGRSGTSDIQTKIKGSSQSHCEIQFDGEIPVLFNNAKNGTIVNEKLIYFGKVLQNGDNIKLTSTSSEVLTI